MARPLRIDQSTARPPLESILSGCLAAGKRDRDLAMFNAWRNCGYTQREISEKLGLHFTAVSRALKRFTETER